MFHPTFSVFQYLRAVPHNGEETHSVICVALATEVWKMCHICFFEWLLIFSYRSHPWLKKDLYTEENSECKSLQQCAHIIVSIIVIFLPHPWYVNVAGTVEAELWTELSNANNIGGSGITLVGLTSWRAVDGHAMKCRCYNLAENIKCWSKSLGQEARERIERAGWRRHEYRARPWCIACRAGLRGSPACEVSLILNPPHPKLGASSFGLGLNFTALPATLTWL